jgi:hypothetical protein
MDFFDFLIFVLIFLLPLLQQIIQKNRKRKGAGKLPSQVQHPTDGSQVSAEQVQLQDALREIRAALGVPTQETKPQPAGPKPRPSTFETRTAPFGPSLIRSQQPSTPKQGLLPPRPINRPTKQRPVPPKQKTLPVQETALQVAKPPGADILSSLVNNLKDTRHTRDAILLSEILGPPRSVKPWR